MDYTALTLGMKEGPIRKASFTEQEMKPQGVGGTLCPQSVPKKRYNAT